MGVHQKTSPQLTLERESVGSTGKNAMMILFFVIHSYEWVH